MELHEYWSIIRRRWRIPAVITAIALLVSAFIAVRGATAYETKLRLAVSTVPTVNANDAFYDPVYYSNLDSEYLADDLSNFLTSTAFAEQVSNQIHRTLPPATISNATRAEKTHRFIDVTITTSTAQEGQQIAGAMNQILNTPSIMDQYLKALGAYNTKVTTVVPPSTARAASLPVLASEIGLRALIGVILGFGLAFLVDYLDTSLRDRRDVERTLELPILVEVPAARGPTRREPSKAGAA